MGNTGNPIVSLYFSITSIKDKKLGKILQKEESDAFTTENWINDRRNEDGQIEESLIHWIIFFLGKNKNNYTFQVDRHSMDKE